MAQTPYNAPVSVSYYHIANAGTYLVKGVPGQVFSVNMNSATSGATFEMFDQATTATGTVVIAGPINLGTANVLPSHLDIGPSYCGVNFKTGLVVLTTGTLDLMVAFR